MQAPDLPEGSVKRTPLHLALVLDRSGSMNGSPLEEAKRCARNIIDRLAPGDRAAIFAFDDEIERVAPLTPASEKLALSAALASIGSGARPISTAVGVPAPTTRRQLAGERSSRHPALRRCANVGEADFEQSRSMQGSRAAASDSTYGLGNHFNEALMLSMASAGRGAYYGQTAADLAEPFAAEFALLTSLSRAGWC
jgi:Ca-activated chloride channel family protein